MSPIIDSKVEPIGVKHLVKFIDFASSASMLGDVFLGYPLHDK